MNPCRFQVWSFAQPIVFGFVTDESGRRWGDLGNLRPWSYLTAGTPKVMEVDAWKMNFLGE